MDKYNLKYTVSYSNISGDSFLLEILQKGDFSHAEQELAGAVIYQKPSINDMFEPIRATSLTINLSASVSNVLQDFQSFNEFDFKVKFYRNGLQIFEGWINPDGYFQDWVNDKWEISMTAVDGLGTIGNLEFSDRSLIKKGFFSLISAWTESNTVLTIEILGAQNWGDLGLLVGTNLRIVTGTNIGVYNTTSISGSTAVFSIVTPPEIAFFNGQFGCDIEWNDYKYAPREINYLHAILERLSYELPYVIGDDINVDLGVPVDWVDVKKRIIDRNVFINDNGTFQDCKTVLIDILQKYNLTITQENIDGRLVWYISRAIYTTYPNAIKRNRQYNTTIDASGGSEAVEVVLVQFAFADGNPKLKTIFSEINATPGSKFDAIHCNENQQITFNPVVQNFRFQSKWKGLRTFLGAIDEDWNENTPLPQYPLASNQWGIFNGYIRMWQVFTGDLILTPWFFSKYIKPPTPINIGINVLFDWWVDYNFVNPAVEVPAPVKFQFVLEYKTTTFERFYNLEDNVWQDTVVLNIFTADWPTPGAQPVGVVTGKTEILAPPGGENISGEYRILIYSPFGDNTGYHECRIMDVNFGFQTEQFGTGKTHDSTQPEKRSTYLVPAVDIINTNEPNAYFQNNLYRLALPPETVTGLVPMNKWKAWNTDEYEDLLELTGRERVKARATPQMIFKGDIFGYIPYASTIKYDGIPGNFTPLSYIYDTAENMIQLESAQVFNENVVINHEKKFIFENERNVLIKEL